jgi:hypothetical protein
MKKAASVLLAGTVGAATLLAGFFALPLRRSRAEGTPAGAAPTANPQTFIAGVNEDLRRLAVKSSTAEWIKNT